jgi:hypothetical protein
MNEPVTMILNGDLLCETTGPNEEKTNGADAFHPTLPKYVNVGNTQNVYCCVIIDSRFCMRRHCGRPFRAQTPGSYERSACAQEKAAPE